MLLFPTASERHRRVRWRERSPEATRADSSGSGASSHCGRKACACRWRARRGRRACELPHAAARALPRLACELPPMMAGAERARGGCPLSSPCFDLSWTCELHWRRAPGDAGGRGGASFLGDAREADSSSGGHCGASTLGGARELSRQCNVRAPSMCLGAAWAGEGAHSGAGDSRARPSAGARACGTTARARATGRLAGEADRLATVPATRGRARRRGRRAQSNP